MKLAKLRNNKKQNGFTLIELLVVLVVISVLTLVGMAVKPKVMAYVNNFQVSSAVDQISTQAAIWRGSNFSYDGISIKAMCDEKLLGKDICGDTNDGIRANPFGGDYAVTSSRTYGNQHINVKVTNISNGALSGIQSAMMYRSIEQCTKFTDCNSVGKTTTSGRGGSSSTAIDIDV